MKMTLHIFVAVLALCGCATKDNRIPSALSQQPHESIIAVGDMLTVVCLTRGERIESKHEVGPSGDISLPDVGQIHVAGFAPHEAARKIEQAIEVFYAPRPSDCRFEVFRATSLDH